MNHNDHNEEVSKSFALRLLIHYLGDIHQPLHCASRVDDEYPEGDRGGNSFPLRVSGFRNLHMLWDSVLEELADDHKGVSHHINF